MRSGIRQILVVLTVCAVTIAGIGSYFNIVRSNTVKGPFVPDQLQGVSVWHEGREYPLNFDQLGELLAILRQGERLMEKMEGGSPGIDRITLYRFEGEDLQLQPVAMLDGELLFAIPALGSGYLKERSGGRLVTLLEECHD